MNIRKYIYNINRNDFFGGELEIGIATNIYNINIATYNKIRDNNNIIGLNPINYYSNHNDNNEQRYLLILTNSDNIHFRIAYYNTSMSNHLDMQFNIPDIKKEEYNNFVKDNEINLEQINEILKNLTNLKNNKLEDILNIYKYHNNKDIGLDDIYYYLYYYNINNKIKGKYPKIFLDNIKDKNIKSKKLLLDDDLRLVKLIKISIFS